GRLAGAGFAFEQEGAPVRAVREERVDAGELACATDERAGGRGEVAIRDRLHGAGCIACCQASAAGRSRGSARSVVAFRSKRVGFRNFAAAAPRLPSFTSTNGQEVGMKKSFVMLVLVAVTAAALALQAGTATAAPPVQVNWVKHATDPANFVFAGTTSGDAPGTLASHLVSLDASTGTVLHVTFEWDVTSGDK